MAKAATTNKAAFKVVERRLKEIPVPSELPQIETMQMGHGVLMRGSDSVYYHVKTAAFAPFGVPAGCLLELASIASIEAAKELPNSDYVIVSFSGTRSELSILSIKDGQGYRLTAPKLECADSHYIVKSRACISRLEFIRLQIAPLYINELTR